MPLTQLPTKQDQLSDLLDHVGAALDISPELYRLAERRYREVGHHLVRVDSSVARFSPAIFPQGSFRLGTIITPLVEAADYDVDLVCLLHLPKDRVTQRELKEMIGFELRLGWQRVQERRRCWTLPFEEQFHLDVLPAIPDLELPPTGILLTDRELRLWQHSDPKAYAQWFESRMAAVFREAKLRLASQLRADVADVPDWQVRTPLQRVVQLLKRHRDVYFEQDLDHRPASIILTTLAAQLYRGQQSVADALVDVVSELPSAPRRMSDEGFEVLNPVNPKENFADKWNEDPALPKAFFGWVAAVQEDIREWLGEPGGLHRLSPSLAFRFGSAPVDTALKVYGDSLKKSRESGRLAMAAGSGQLVGSAGGPGLAKVPPHTFYGD